MKVHIQLIVDEPNRVCVNGKEVSLDASLLIANHSPTGFNWGYHGSGPAQCALAICIELFGVHIAKSVYQYFKTEFVAEWKSEGEYQINVAEFFEERILPVMELACGDWAQQLMWQTNEAFDAEVLCGIYAINDNTMTATFTVEENDQALNNVRSLCEETGYRCYMGDGNLWFMEAKFLLTTTMIGLMTTDAINQTSNALDAFGKVLVTARDTAKNLSLE